MAHRPRNQLVNLNNKPFYFANSIQKGVFEQHIESQNDEQHEMIQNQIKHLIYTTILNKMFAIVQKPYKYSFSLIKNIFQMKETNYQYKIKLMIQILDNKVKIKKRCLFIKLKEELVKFHQDIYRGLCIMEIALNKKLINHKVNSFLRIKQICHLNYIDKQSNSLSINNNSIGQKINYFLIEIFKVHITIAINNFQRYRKGLMLEVFKQIKLYSSYKKIQQQKIYIQQKNLQKINSIFKIQTFLIKKQLKSNMKTFQILKSFNIDSFQKQNHQQEKIIKLQKSQHKKVLNPQLSTYISSIKSLITSLNKFQSKSKVKNHTQKHKQAILIIKNFIEIKSILLLKSTFYMLFTSQDYQMERDKLQVLERQVMALKEDMEDL